MTKFCPNWKQQGYEKSRLEFNRKKKSTITKASSASWDVIKIFHSISTLQILIVEKKKNNKQTYIVYDSKFPNRDEILMKKAV